MNTQPDFSEADPTGDTGLAGGKDPLQVLLIEDNPGDARLFEEHLGESRVEAALRHEPALEAGLSALREERPGVLALDLGLPDSEGPGTVAAAVSAAPEVPIVVLTGQDSLDVALQAQQAGAAQYLQKGELTPELLGRTLRWAAQRARMQRKLRQRDAWVRSITESLSAGVFRAGPTGRIEYANEALAQMLGFEEGEELVGQDLTEFCADPSQKGRMLAQEGAEGMEVKFRRPDESVVVGLLSARPAYDTGGQVLHYDGTITNITARKEKERKLRVLSEAIGQANEAVLITEAEPLGKPGPRIEYVNEAFEKMSGYSEEELLGKTPRIFQGPETDRAVLDSMRESLEAGEAWEGESVNYRKDGTPYQVQWHVSPVRDAPVGKEDGEIIRWVSVQRDVTEKRRRERELERQNDLFARAQEIADIGAWEYDLASGDLFWTKQVHDIHGLPITYEPTPEKAFKLYHPDDRPIARDRFRQAIEEGKPYDIELRVRRADGEERWVRARGIPQTEGGEITESGQITEGGEGTGGGEVTKVRGTFRDITERKDRRQRLKSLRERLELAVGGAGLGTWDWDIETGEVVFNHRWAEMLGYSREELDFHFSTWEDLAHPEDLPVATEALEAHLEGETELYQQEIRMRAKSGDWKWIRTIGRVAGRDEEGVPTRVVGIHLDIDDRKRSEQELRARVAAMEASIDGMAILAPSEEYQFVNQAHAHIYDYDDPEAFVGKTWRMCYGEAEQARFDEEIFPALREEGSWRGEAAGQRRDGTTFPQEVSLTLTDEGKIVGVVRDITGRKERELRREAAFENTYQLTGLMKPDGTLIEANETALAFVGADREEVVGKPLWKTPWFQASGETVETARRSVEVARSGELYQGELPIENAEGETSIFDYSVRPIRDETGKVALLVPEGRNVTERVEQKRALERKNARLDSFAGLVSHDLRNPLNVATGRLQLAREERGPEGDSKGGAGHLEAVESALGRMDAIIEDVLTLTWGGRALGPESLSTRSLGTLAEAAWDQVDTVGASLRLDDPPSLRCDENRLQRLLENLFRNAVEHAGEAPTVRVGALPDGFYVEDDGPGLPVESSGVDSEAVFEAGYSSSEEGTGLGLSIVKSIVETHGWALMATESPMGGARFEVSGVEVQDVEVQSAEGQGPAFNTKSS